MTGEQFLDALRLAVDPRTIANIKGSDSGVLIVLSDGKQVNVKRRRIADLDTAEDMRKYVEEVLS